MKNVNNSVKKYDRSSDDRDTLVYNEFKYHL